MSVQLMQEQRLLAVAIFVHNGKTEEEQRKAKTGSPFCHPNCLLSASPLVWGASTKDP